MNRLKKYGERKDLEMLIWGSEACLTVVMVGRECVCPPKDTLSEQDCEATVLAKLLYVGCQLTSD